MSTQSCSYQIHPPVDAERLRPAQVHPDPQIYARMATVARQHQARRFALCHVVHTQPDTQPGPGVVVEYLGWQYRDGVTVTNIHGHPIGWYTSIDTAHHYLVARRSTPLWLVWLEVGSRHASSDQATAALEASGPEPEMFVAGVGFIACGPADARLHAIRLTEAAETFLPEVQRHAVLTYGVATGPVGVFCRQFGCVRPTGHSGHHHITEPEPEHHAPPKYNADDVELSPEEQEAVDHARAQETTNDPAADDTDTAFPANHDASSTAGSTPGNGDGGMS